MNEKRPSHLRAVPSIPGSAVDHGLHLTEASGQVSMDEAEVRSKLDLIFAWPDSCHVTATLTGNPPITVPCALTFDSDEAFPTEIYVSLRDNELAGQLQLLSRLRINVELFRTC